MLIKLALPTLKYRTRKFIIFKRKWSNIADIKLPFRMSQKITYIITSWDFPGMSSLSDVFWTWIYSSRIIITVLLKF